MRSGDGKPLRLAESRDLATLNVAGVVDRKISTVR